MPLAHIKFSVDDDVDDLCLRNVGKKFDLTAAYKPENPASLL